MGIVIGCATTQQVEVGQQTERASCAFLGDGVFTNPTASQTPDRLSSRAARTDAAPVAGLRHVDPNAQWTRYEKIAIAPVTLWGGDDTKVPPGDQRAVHPILREAAVESATPSPRTISMIAPQARGLSMLESPPTGGYAFVGGATVEAKVLDSMTHERLAAAIDRRVGGGSIEAAARWEWGNAENAMQSWARRLADRLASWRSGVRFDRRREASGGDGCAAAARGGVAR